MNDIRLTPDAALLEAGTWLTPQEPAAQQPASALARPYSEYHADGIMRDCGELELKSDLGNAVAALQPFGGDDVLLCHTDPDGGGMYGLRGSGALTKANIKNQRGHAIYFHLNAVKPEVVKKAKKEDITAIRGVCGDIDWGWEEFSGRFEEGCRALEAKLQELMDMAAPPSLIILTGGGVQPIWLLAVPLQLLDAGGKPLAAAPDIVARTEALGRGIANRFGGDPVQNSDRVLRVPWLINYPKVDKRNAGQPTRLAAVIYPKEVLRYTLEQLEQAWKAAGMMNTGGAARKNPRRGLPTGVTGGSGGITESEQLKDIPPDVNDDLSAGLDHGWFERLSGDDRDAALKQMFAVLPNVADGPRGPAKGVGPPMWLDCLMAAHASGAPHAEEIARQWSMLSEKKYDEDDFNKQWGSLADKPSFGKRITIGTLIWLATARGFDADAWRAHADGAKLAAQMGIPLPSSPAAGSARSVPPVGGKPLLTTLPPQTLQDTPGNRERIMEALDRRLAADPYTFQSGDRLISLRISPGAAALFPQIVDRDPSASSGGPTPAVMDEGDMPVMLETTDADVVYLADHDHWLGYMPGRVAEGGKPKLRRVHAPPDTCKLYLRLSRTKAGFRQLNGLARVPIIDDAGNLDFGVGYHTATGIFRDRTPVLNVPDNPTRDDCRAALNVLGLPFQEYRFEDQKTGRVLILTLIFTALERPFIRTSPMFGINGVAGVGKGKLLRSVSQLAFDTRPRFMTYGFNAEEFDKRLGAMFRVPAPCLVIDNANGKRISNDTLESIITEGEEDIRTLGKSEFVHVVNRSLLIATGRGLEFSGDMTRRELTINLLATDGSPERRRFALDPPTYVAEHRDEMLTAAFTIMRAFRQAGMPKMANTAAGSFPEWERRVRDLVMWLTKIDVTDQFARNREIASDKQADAALLHALYRVFGNQRFRASAVLAVYDGMAQEKRVRGALIPTDLDQLAEKVDQAAQDVQAAQQTGKGLQAAQTNADAAQKALQTATTHNANIALYEALEEQFGDKQVNARRLGWWARSVENAHIAGLRMARTSDGEGHTDLCIVATDVVT